MTYIMNMPAGEYEAIATMAWIEDRRAKQDGTFAQEHLRVKFRILENGPNGEPTFGQEVEWRGYFSDAALPYTLRQMRACGWTGNDVTRVESMTEAGGGRRVYVQVIHNEFNGKLHTKVNFINAERSGPREMQAEQKESFAQRMREKVKLEVAKDPQLKSPIVVEESANDTPDVPF